jgi:hypothetical protein
MNIKKQFLISLAITALCSHNVQTASMRTTLLSTTEQSFNNMRFRHIIKSDQLAEEYFVNDIPVLEDDYYQKMDDAEQIEREQKREKDIEQRRQKIEFTVNAQNKITAKLTLQTIEQIEAAASKLQHPALTNYILFSSETVPSQHELEELVSVISYVKREIPKLIQTRDTPRLEFYESKLAPYPEKLELLFRSSVNEAIEKCDNTSNLKELLELVA